MSKGKRKPQAGEQPGTQARDAVQTETEQLRAPADRARPGGAKARTSAQALVRDTRVQLLIRQGHDGGALALAAEAVASVRPPPVQSLPLPFDIAASAPNP